MNGKIKRIVSERGFGFILGEDGKEYFFHHTALVGTRMDTLESGDRVRFEEDPQGNQKGPRAGVVQVL